MKTMQNLLRQNGYHLKQQNNLHIPYYQDQKLDNGFITPNLMWQVCYTHYLQLNTKLKPNQIKNLKQQGYFIDKYPNNPGWHTFHENKDYRPFGRNPIGWKTQQLAWQACQAQHHFTQINNPE